MGQTIKGFVHYKVANTLKVLGYTPSYEILKNFSKISPDMETVCPVCFRDYDNSTIQRQFLECGHEVCSECLDIMLSMDSITCEACQTEVSSPGLSSKYVIPKKYTTPCYDDFYSRDIQPSCDLIFKIGVVGESMTGKTKLVHKFYEDRFMPSSIVAIGVDILFKSFIINKRRINLEIWSSLPRMPKTSRKGINHECYGAILCFDTTKRKSFEKLEEWIRVIEGYHREQYEIIIVGTKTDLDYLREVSFQEANNFAKSYGFDYIEISARAGLNVVCVFLTIMEKMRKKNIDDEKLAVWNY